MSENTCELQFFRRARRSPHNRSISERIGYISILFVSNCYILGLEL
jgi:hypothetical protein